MTDEQLQIERRKLAEERHEQVMKAIETLTDKVDRNTIITFDTKNALELHCKGEEVVIKELAEVRTEVYGNGKPGNKTDITNLKAAVKSLWKVLGGAWAVILALIPVVATIVWEIAKVAARKGP